MTERRRNRPHTDYTEEWMGLGLVFTFLIIVLYVLYSLYDSAQSAQQSAAILATKAQEDIRIMHKFLNLTAKDVRNLDNTTETRIFALRDLIKSLVAEAEAARSQIADLQRHLLVEQEKKVAETEALREELFRAVEKKPSSSP